jgi:hypothetical protein
MRACSVWSFALSVSSAPQASARLEERLLGLVGADAGTSSVFLWEVWSFPLTMHLLAHADMPFPILGAIHVANRTRGAPRAELPY